MIPSLHKFSYSVPYNPRDTQPSQPHYFYLFLESSFDDPNNKYSLVFYSCISFPHRN